MISEDRLLRRPTMLRILISLSEGPKTLSFLSKELGVNKPRLKKYLEELEELGFVEAEYNGMKLYKLKRIPELFNNTRNS